MADVAPVRHARLEMPYQLFTLSDNFLSCAGGTIYVGQPNSDPTNPVYQVQVYAQEGELHTELPQPININYGGYPVNSSGQPVVLTVKEAYCMAVYNAAGQREFYCASYTPELLQEEEDIDIDFSGLYSQDVMSVANTKPLATTTEPDYDKPNEIGNGKGGIWIRPPSTSAPASWGYPSDSGMSPGILLSLTGGAFEAQLYFTGLPPAASQMWYRTGYTEVNPANNQWNPWIRIA